MRSTAAILFCALSIAAMTSRADVTQCVDDSGKLLLTDAFCPPGYRANLVVSVPPPAPPPALAMPSASEPDAAQGDVARLEAENRRLRDALAAQRLERLEGVERRLDALDEWPQPQVFGVMPGPLYALPRHRDCPDGKRCGSAPHPRRSEPVTRSREDCGTFGCTPSVIRSPWDGERNAFDPSAPRRPSQHRHSPHAGDARRDASTR
jgi:hypothetical protein